MTRVIAISLLAALLAWRAFGQATANPPAFEVAAVKVNTSGGIAAEKERLLPGGRVELSNATLKELIVPAYGVKSNLILGGPKWMDTVRYDIVAKAPPDTPIPTLLVMIRTLLEERFKLTFHHEDRIMPAYALVVGKGGPKLRQAKDGGQQNCGSREVNLGGVPVVHRECRGVTIAELARQLGLGGYGLDARPVVDLTELAGAYDFEFEYTRPPAAGRGDAGRSGDAPAPPDLAGPTIFDAMVRLGLKLEASRQSVPVIVIDRAEQPVE
jgi:uncharacterized protein (TIGR03435 family)